MLPLGKFLSNGLVNVYVLILLNLDPYCDFTVAQ